MLNIFQRLKVRLPKLSSKIDFRCKYHGKLLVEVCCTVEANVWSELHFSRVFSDDFQSIFQSDISFVATMNCNSTRMIETM